MNIHALVLNEPIVGKASKIEAIKLLHEPGMSARDIADALSRHLREHVTRNAVIGLYSRNKDTLAKFPLQPRGGVGPAKARPGPRKSYSPRPVKVKIAPPAEDISLTIVKPTEYDATARLLTLADLNARRECKWPISGYGAAILFCGHESDGTYCQHHRARSVRAQKAGEGA